MSKKLYLVGSDHFHHDFKWLLEQIKKIMPDCITLEQKIDGSACLYWDFKDLLDEVLSQYNEQQRTLGEFAAGVCYAREKGIPIYLIDEYHPFRISLLTNLNQGDNFEIIKGDKHLLKKEAPIQEKEYEYFTRMNMFMALAINYHFQISGHDTIVHIGGRGHYDPKRCNPLQDLVLADAIQIIDAVNRTRTDWK